MGSCVKYGCVPNAVNMRVHRSVGRLNNRVHLTHAVGTPMRRPARFVVLLALLAATTFARGQPAIDGATLKARISQLPSTVIDLRKAATSGEVRPAPKPPPAVVLKPETKHAPAAKAPAAKSTVDPKALGHVFGATMGKPITLPKTPKRETATPASTAIASAAGLARYAPLPQEDAQAVRALLAAQIKSQLPGGVTPEFEAFQGAVMIQAIDASEVTLVPVVYADDPLRFARESGQFEGRIAVGLVELDGAGPAKKLSAPIGFQVFGDGRAEPEIAQIDSTSPPYTSIKIASPDPRDAVELRVVSNVSAEPVSLHLPVERARLALSAKPNLQGWGLESTEVTVQASDGSASRGEVVVLSASRGSLSGSRVELGSDGTASVKFRSESTGTALLDATNPRLRPAKVEIAFEFPTRFLLAGFLGGLAGGLLRRGLKRSRSPRRLALELLLGVICGALVFGLFVLGVNVLGLPLPRDGGEVLVAVIASLGAFFGTQLLKSPAAPA